MAQLQTAQSKPRALYVDAMKGLGILLVVFGHFIEYYRGASPWFNAAFEGIYFFHMALFCIASGLVAKFSIKKWALQQLWLYLIAQLLMLLCRVATGEGFADGGAVLRAVLEPWRHMWYLYALLWWGLTIPVLQWLRKKGMVAKIIGVAVACAIGLCSGYLTVPFWVGGRTLPFYLFFAIGYLLAEELAAWVALAKRSVWVRLVAGATFCVGYGIFFFDVITAPEPAVYLNATIFQSENYLAAGYTPASRVAFYLIGILSTLALMAVFGQCKPLAKLGQKTLPLYILHMPIYAILVELGVCGVAGEHAALATLVWVLFAAGGTIAILTLPAVCKATSFVADFWYKVLPRLMRSKSTE